MTKYPLFCWRPNERELISYEATRSISEIDQKFSKSME